MCQNSTYQQTFSREENIVRDPLIFSTGNVQVHFEQLFGLCTDFSSTLDGGGGDSGVDDADGGDSNGD
jgi:hypothetical protein